MKRQKGFTLSELMVGLGVLSTLVLLASVLTTWAAYRYFSIRDRLSAEAEAYKAEAVFRSVFGSALDIAFNDTGSTVNGIPQDLGTHTGQIYANQTKAGTPSRRFFEFDQIADSQTWTRIATFFREGSTGIVGQVSVAGASRKAVGRALPTMVFYHAPSLTKSGAIFFDLSSPNSSTSLVYPDFGDVFIDRVSTFGITKVKHQSFDKVTAIEVHLRLRYHTFAGKSESWCPQLDIGNNTGGCRNGSLSRDIERNFTVTLSNNLIKPQGSYSGMLTTSELRTFGDIYFFKMTSPTR
jgi:prepilin-type N-terminal cleavage/methylation domain-containing protein